MNDDNDDEKDEKSDDRKTPPPPPGPEVRRVPGKILDGAHGAAAAAADLLIELLDDERLPDDVREKLRKASRAAEYAHEMVAYHQERKQSAEASAAMVIGMTSVMAMGTLLGRVISVPSEPGGGTLRELVNRLPPDYKAKGIEALRSAVKLAQGWLDSQTVGTGKPAEQHPAQGPCPVCNASVLGSMDAEGRFTPKRGAGHGMGCEYGDA